MASILILGAGTMGSAFSFPLADAGHTVYLVGTHLDNEWIKAVQARNIHPKLKIEFPDMVIPFTHEQLDEALCTNPDLIVLGVSSAGIPWAIQKLGPLMKKPVPVLLLTKGLAVEEDALLVLPEVVRRGLAEYGIKDLAVGGVGGPCIARELGARRDTCVEIAFPDSGLFEYLFSIVTTQYYHAHFSTDVIGVEACAALKNFYTLAISYPNGLMDKQGQSSSGALMHNLSAALFSQAILEMSLIINYMGGTADSVHGLPGVGDLYVTCQAGRNSRMGYLLGTGLNYSEAKAKHMAKETVEGAELAFVIGPLFNRLFTQGRLDRERLPLTAAIIDTICHNRPMQIKF